MRANARDESARDACADETREEGHVENGTLHLCAKDGAEYDWENVTQVRLATRELRWTNARGEKRSMALAFLKRWWVTIEKEGKSDRYRDGCAAAAG